VSPRPFFGRLAAVLVGVAIGIAIGLGIAWGLAPVQYTNADPADLRSAYKDDYIRMIGAAFEMDGDLAGAKRRLSLLYPGAPAKTVNDFLAREKERSKDMRTQAAVFHLAQVLYGTVAYSTPTPVPTALPTSVALAGISQPSIPVFRLIERSPLTCDDEPAQGRLRFYVRDTRGADLPNVAIEIRWPSGDDTVYTGFKPERGIGYADFAAAPDTFTVTVLNASGDSATDLLVGSAPANCQADHGTTPRGWKLVFQQQ
jgi:hypothetical protein